MTQLQNCKTLKELMTYLGDESVCRSYMEQTRWNGNPVCPHCGEENPYKLKDGKTYRCRAKTCKKDFTVTVGTVLKIQRFLSRPGSRRLGFYLPTKRESVRVSLHVIWGSVKRPHGSFCTGLGMLWMIPSRNLWRKSSKWTRRTSGGSGPT